MIWRVMIAILLAACGKPMAPPGGGGDDVVDPPPGDNPEVLLGAVSCLLASFDTASIDIDADVTLATGMAVDVTISLPVPPGSTTFSQFFACASWSPLTDGAGNISGCHRSGSDQPAMDQISLNHSETFSDGIPPGTNVGIVMTVRSAPFSPSSLASDATNVTCN